MAIINRNIWLLYKIVVCILLLIAVLMSADAWRKLHKKFTIDQESFIQVATNSAKWHLDRYSAIFEVMEEFLEPEALSAPSAVQVIDFLINKNPFIANLGLYSATGNKVISSHGHLLIDDIEPLSFFPDLLENKNMVIGQTRYDPISEDFYMSFAKALRNSEGDVFAIAVMAINTDNGWALIKRKGDQPPFRKVSVTFGNEYFFLTIPDDHSIADHNLYSKPLSKTTVSNFDNALYQKYGLTSSDLTNSEKVVTVPVYIPRFSEKMLTSSEHIQQYSVRLSTHTPLSEVKGQLFMYWTLIWGGAGFIALSLYYAFSALHKHQESRQKALSYQANHDYLTGLYNSYFLSSFFQGQETSSDNYWVIAFNLSSFKRINQTFGHSRGDMVLKQVAKCLTSNVTSGYVVRHSGDEFFWITSQTQKDALKTAEITKQEIEKICAASHADSVSRLRVNVGVASSPDCNNSLECLKKAVCYTLAESKLRQGEIVCFDEGIRSKYQEKHDLEAALKAAMLRDEIFIAYQPQVDNGGKIVGVEGLARWIHPERGFIPPDKFIAIAESSGQMPQLGWHIINKVLSDLQEINAVSPADFRTSINISPTQLMQAGFVEGILNSLSNYDIEASQLTLELTENVFIEDTDYVIQVMKQLRKIGFNLSLDDFGTGYSSLGLLNQLIFDELKLDKSFVDSIAIDHSAETMISRIIEIGKDKDMTVVAEGIEELKQKSLLDKHGCDIYQGYYFSKPLVKSDLIRQLSENPFLGKLDNGNIHLMKSNAFAK